MNSLIKNGYLKEMICDKNIAYILNEDNMFKSTEYKVLHSQMNNCFVGCMKMLFNGKTQLYYLTSEYKSLTSLISSLTPEMFIVIIKNLLSDIIDVKNNGFLSCQNIVISMNRIYIDIKTNKVNLIYLPLNRGVYEDELLFDNEIRSELIKLISNNDSLSSSTTMNLLKDLADGTLSIEDIYERLNSNKPSKRPDTITPIEKKKSLQIVALDAPERIIMYVNKDEYVIGKNSTYCDGILTFNKMISRKHCKIIKDSNKWLIMDLKSANGTYVNKMRLTPEVPVAINNGDIIRMANSNFQVIIKE